MNRQTLFVFCLGMFIIGQISAQDSSIQTLEDLYLSTDIEILLLRSQAVSDSRDSKLQAIDTIQNMRANNRLAGNESAVFAVLNSLAREGLFNRVIENGRVINDFPEVRRRAVYLLGDLGSPRAQEIIYDVINEETVTAVLAEAMYALARSTQIDEERVSIYITDTLRRNTTQPYPDGTLALACLEAVETLRISDPDLLLEVVNLVNGPYVDAVRSRGLEVLNKIRDGQI